MRRFLVGLALFVAVITCGRVAYAEIQQPWNTIIYGPIKTGGVFGSPVYTEVGVCAWGRSAAALVALGYSGSTIDGLSAEVKAKLSNQSTGGRFWAFAQNFNLPEYEDDFSIYGTTWRGFVDLLGEGNVWRGYYEDEEAIGARVDADTIISGGSVGGGGSSGGNDSDYLICNMTSCTRTNNSGVSNTYLYPFAKDSESGTSYYMYQQSYMPSYWQLKIPKSLITNGEDIYLVHAQISRNLLYINLWTVGDYTATEGTLTENNSGDSVPYSLVLHGSTEIYRYQIILNNNASELTYAFDGSLMLINSAYQSTRARKVITDNENINLIGSNLSCYCLNDFGTSGPTLPPTNWPDPPTTDPPTEPTVPQPDPPTTDPRPVEPVTPTLPFFPIESTYPDVSYDTADLEAVLDAMNEHCQHLQSAIYQGFADYFDTFTPWLSQELATLRACIRGESEWQITALNSQFDDLQDYLWQLFQWLADKMDFTFTDSAYDDSSLVWWLKRIYYKLQSSPVNTRPFDPVSDSDGAWDWLGKFISDLLARLSEGAGDLANRLLGLFDDIKDKFPFSIPWDMAAVLVLFDVPAQTPAFTVQFEVIGTPVVFEVDLHFMDEYAETIRAMESILFCFYLLFKTQWLTGVFDDLGGYLGGKLGYKEG